jgi:hypothetical protein
LDAQSRMTTSAAISRTFAQYDPIQHAHRSGSLILKLANIATSPIHTFYWVQINANPIIMLMKIMYLHNNSGFNNQNDLTINDKLCRLLTDKYNCYEKT